MKISGKTIIYSINVDDIQDVSDRVVGRQLTAHEINLMRDSVGDFIDWTQAIAHAIHKHIPADASLRTLTNHRK